MSEQTCLTLQEDCYTKSQYYTWLKLQKECINLKKIKSNPYKDYQIKIITAMKKIINNVHPYVICIIILYKYLKL